MKVILSGEAKKQYGRLNEPMLGRITDALDDLEKEPPKGDIKRLSGRPGVFRVQVGGYRILYVVRENHIRIEKIAPRGQAYKE